MYSQSPKWQTSTLEGVLDQREDGFWVERIPRPSRTSTWLRQTATDLHAAALSWSSPFDVTRDDIEDHIQQPDEVVVLRDMQRVVGFVAASAIVPLSQTGFKARYIAGTIVHRDLGGKSKFERLMRHFPVRADIEVLHTQSPFMAKALANRSKAIFPAPRASQRLSEHLFSDIRYLFEAENRKASFCPVTGIAPDFYERCLYKNWPLPGEGFDSSFRYVAHDDTSAVVVVGFADAVAASRHLSPSVLQGERA